MTINKLSPDEALTQAIALGGQGYSCFPVSKSKTPLKGSHGYKDACSDVLGLTDLWHRFPGPLVGIATGTNVSVLDLDQKHPEAHAWWQDNRDRLLPTRVHRTRSGGLHLVFQHRAGVGCNLVRAAQDKPPVPGVEIKGERGSAIWWPAAGFEVLSEGPLAPWPEFLATKDTRKPVEWDGRPAGLTLQRAMGLIRVVKFARAGERNRVLFWAASRVKAMVQAKEIGERDAQEMLGDLYVAAKFTGLRSDEIKQTLRSAMGGAS